jgi:hypothetical protein
MNAMTAMFGEERWGARFCEACSWDAGAGEFLGLGPAMLGTSAGPGVRGIGDAKAKSKILVEHLQIAFTSCGASVCGRGDRTITKKSIGRGMSILRESFNGRSVFGDVLLGVRAGRAGLGVALGAVPVEIKTI